MAETVNWKSGLIYYKKNIAIECEDEENAGKLIKNLSAKILITCPFEIVGHALIIPKNAKGYLNLYGIEHKIVELTHTRYLSEDILQEINKRYCYAVQPNYYVSNDLIITKNFVKTAVVQKIQEALKNKK